MAKAGIRIAFAAIGVIAIAIAGAVLTGPVWAQVRAALVRDIDTPSLAPFRAGVVFTLGAINDQRLLTTVPAGKRLVLEYLSYSSFGPIGDQLIFGSLRNGQFGPTVVFLEINPPHASAVSSLTLQDGSQPVKAYFESGEEVWVSVSHITGGGRQVEVRVVGHLITP